MVRALATVAERSQVQDSLCMRLKNNFVQPAGDGYLTLFRDGKGDGGEEEE